MNANTCDGCDHLDKWGHCLIRGMPTGIGCGDYRERDQMSDTIKVFKVSDCDWFAAKTAKEARQCAIEWTENDEWEWDEDEIEELTDEQMNRFTYREEDEPEATRRTFREELDRMIARGDKFPCMFASTDY